MPRSGRKQLVTSDEDTARRDREGSHRRLGIELRRFWREACRTGIYRDGTLNVEIYEDEPAERLSA